MSLFSFIHAADIHLDSPLLRLERYEGAPVEELRQATRRAFGNLVELATGEGVAFVLIAGDLYDGDWRDYNTGLYLVSQMTRLREAGIPVFIITGNHDRGPVFRGKTLGSRSTVRASQGRQFEMTCPHGTRLPFRGISTSACCTRAQRGGKVTNLTHHAQLRGCFRRDTSTGLSGMFINKS